MCGILLLALGSLQVSAQQNALRFDAPVGSHGLRQVRDAHSLRPIRIAKWSTLGAAAGLAIYGFARSEEADGAFSDLERACNADPARCTARHADGAYADAALEKHFQNVLDLDQKARTALILSQVSLATSIVLFLLDLRNDGPPPDIPYVPRGLSLSRGCMRGWICFSLRVD